MCHMLSHNEHAEGLPYAHFLTKNFHHFNVNLESELFVSMSHPSYSISNNIINRRMRVTFNLGARDIKYLDNDDENKSEDLSD